MTNPSPYVSIVFGTRNDNYGGGQLEKLQHLCALYRYYSTKWPNLFELVIVEWNPPDNTLY